MPSALPLADPAPLDGLLPGIRRRRRRRAHLRRLPARAVLPGALRLLRLQHLHGRRAARREAVATTPARPSLEVAARRRASSPSPASRGAPASTVFFGGGTPTLLPAGDLVRMLDAVRDTFGIDAGRRGHDGGEPRLGRRRLPRRAGGRRLHPRLASACSRPCRTCWRRSSAPTTPRASRSSSRWAREAGLDVSLDLIYGTPGESLDDWRAQPRARHRAAARPPHRLLAHRRGRHEARAADQARRGGRARRRPAGRHVRAGRRDARRRRLRLVRGQQLGARRRAPLAPQPRLLAGRRLVGRRPRCAQPRRRRALVEREASGGLRRPGPRRASRPAPAARRSTPRPARSSGCCC